MFPQYPNPVNDFYFRNAQMQQGQYVPGAQYPAFQNPQFTPPAQNNPQLICRYVTNIEEAKAAMIDALNNYIFVDSGSGKIYLKRMNNNGLSDFFSYSIDEATDKAPEKKDPFTEINERLSNIEISIGALRNDQSVSGNADVTKSAKPSKAAITTENESNGTTESSSLSESL